MINYDALREVAKWATDGPWEETVEIMDDKSVVYGVRASYGSSKDGDRICHVEGIDRNNIKYIAATNPEVLLKLLDRIDLLQAKLNDTELRATDLFDDVLTMKRKLINIKVGADAAREQNPDLKEFLDYLFAILSENCELT